MKNKKEIIPIILDKSKDIQDVINNELMKEFGKVHNISDSHNYFNAKQELISDRAFFPGPKKKYALHIVNMEGVDVEELELKGLITQRSDYPVVTKQLILNVIKILVENDNLSFEELSDYIYVCREKLLGLIKEGQHDIGKPVSFSKPYEDYKAIPQHISGMMMWNNLEYNYFTTGTRGTLFKIDGIDPSKAPKNILKKLNGIKMENNIVVPYEEEKLPDYYIPSVNDIIAFCWDDRVKELLDPIWSNIDVGAKKDKEEEGMIEIW